MVYLWGVWNLVVKSTACNVACSLAVYVWYGTTITMVVPYSMHTKPTILYRNYGVCITECVVTCDIGSIVNYSYVTQIFPPKIFELTFKSGRIDLKGASI